MALMVRIAEELRVKEVNELGRLEVDSIRTEEQRNSHSSACEAALKVANQLAWLQLDNQRRIKLSMLQVDIGVRRIFPFPFNLFVSF